MSETKETIGKVVAALNAAIPTVFYYDGKPFSYSSTSIANALDAAGLLVTPLHERALKACEDLAVSTHPEKPEPWIASGYDQAVACALIGREFLAAKAPKERWQVWEDDAAPSDPDRFQIFDSRRTVGVATHCHRLTEPQACAVAAALNALESK